jgi:hypothetical protein
MARIVKMEFECSDMDVNDTTVKKLVIRGQVVGKYVVGRCNAWEIDYFDKNGEPITDISCYIAGLLHRKYNMDISTARDVRKAQRKLKKEYGLKIIDCFNRMLDGKEFFPDGEEGKCLR